MAMNILIVDDSALTRKSIRRKIEMMELEIGQIMEAENGREALNIIDTAKVDLVLADLHMPVMDGVTMINQMKAAENTKSISVVIISAEPTTAKVKELISQGVQGYLHKPFTPEEFKKIITNTLEIG
jgi:two-component system, chemotaxis family, chemotaxis protein CheY